jgi:hypothetical protein
LRLKVPQHSAADSPGQEREDILFYLNQNQQHWLLLLHAFFMLFITIITTKGLRPLSRLLKDSIFASRIISLSFFDKLFTL